jgi:hypothetical protein
MQQSLSTPLLQQLIFAPLDDVVMGGASASNFDSNTGIWSGSVTDANRGGFIGLRSTPLPQRYDLSSCQGLEFQLRLVQKVSPAIRSIRLKIALRDSTDFNGISWATIVSIDPTKSLNIVQVPLQNNTIRLIPTLFARKVQALQAFQTAHVAGVQFVYSKFEFDGELNPTFRVGQFGLQILKVATY